MVATSRTQQMSAGSNDDVLSWNSEASITDLEYTILEDGPAIGKVVSFGKSRFQGSAKISPCPMSVITVDLATLDGLKGGEFGELPEGEKLTGFEITFPLNKRFLSRIAAFFKSCGVLGVEETDVPMSLWNDVVGHTFVCETKQREWEGKDGSIRKSNGIGRFLYGEDADAVIKELEEARRHDHGSLI